MKNDELTSRTREKQNIKDRHPVAGDVPAHPGENALPGTSREHICVSVGGQDLELELSH